MLPLLALAFLPTVISSFKRNIISLSGWCKYKQEKWIKMKFTMAAIVSTEIIRYPCHSWWFLTLSPRPVFLHQLQPRCLWSHQPAEKEGESSSDTLRIGGREGGGWCWRSEALPIHMAYRGKCNNGASAIQTNQKPPSQRLLIPRSDEDFNISSPGCLHLHTSRCLIKVELMQPHRNKIFPFDRLGGHNRKLKMNKSALDWCTFPEPFQARCDLSSVHECDAPECIPLLKLLLPEFNLTEANFGKCQDRHTAAEGGWLKGWGSAGRIWLWHLLTRWYRVKPLKTHCEKEFHNLPPCSRCPEGLVMLERWEHVSLIERLS